MSPSANSRGFPLSRDSNETKRSKSLSIRSANLLRSWDFSFKGTSSHLGKAASAASMAFSTSSSVASEISQIFSSVAGLITSVVDFLTPSTNSLLMNNFV